MRTPPSRELATATSSRRLDLPSRDSLQEICAARGPFVTVFLPARHPGAADLPRAERIRTVLRDATEELARRRFQEPIGRLLRPLQELAEDSGELAGGSGSVMFASPGLFRHFALASPTGEHLIVASHPHITPVLSDMILPREFYVLGITNKLLRLGRWFDGRCVEISMPAGLPTSFEDTLLSETPDHDLQSRSATGSLSQAGATRFGTGSERDMVHDRLHQYFQIIDRELTHFLKDAPLVLVGIAQELAAYRSVAQYAHLLCAKPISPAHLSSAEIGHYGEDAVLENQRENAKTVLADFRETNSRDHVVTGVREVLQAAHEGRVHKLLLERNAKHDGLLGPLFPVDSSHIEGEQDLINATAVETIRGRGEVYELDAGQLGSCPVAALLRYSNAPGARNGR
jgi:hypothetical protein